jgi:hypothetical protein
MSQTQSIGAGIATSKLCDSSHARNLPLRDRVIYHTCDDAHSHSYFPLRNFGHINRQIAGLFIASTLSCDLPVKFRERGKHGRYDLAVNGEEGL